MPASEPRTRLGYLFEVLADGRAPEELKKRVRDYLYGEGRADVQAALESPTISDQFKRLSDEARPHAQSGKVIGVLRALATAMPATATIRQALALMIIAQGDFAGEPRRQVDVKNDEPLSASLYSTTLALDRWITSDHAPTDRDKPHRLNAEGRALVGEILRVLRQHQSDTETKAMAALADEADVVGAVERYFNR